MTFWISILFLMMALFLEIMPFVILHSGPQLDAKAFYAAISFSCKTKELRLVSWLIFVILLITYFVQK